MGQEDPDKNDHISKANIAVLPSLCDTTLLSSFPSLLRIKHPSFVHIINFMLAFIIHEKYPVLQKSNISFTSNCIFADLNVKTTQEEVIEFFPFMGRKSILKLFQLCCVYQDNKSRVCGMRASCCG